MRDTKIRLEKLPLRVSIAGAVVALFALLLAGYAPLSLARPSSHSTFKSAEEASQALFLAVQNHDERGLADILGAGSELVSSDDEVQDTLDRERFVQKYRQMHRLAPETHGLMLLYIGAENWPFPIPLVSRNGRWRFDSDAGMEEVRFRRIGENEVTAIALCHMLVAADRSPGTAEAPDGFTATVLTSAKSDNQPFPFHGYYFRILPRAGKGFAAIAYPAAYRSSGVMTFFIDQDDVVREKDLGPNTAKIAGTTDMDNPDSTWTPAETP
jgi:Protein of unknown function (DUF2950)